LTNLLHVVEVMPWLLRVCTRLPQERQQNALSVLQVRKKAIMALHRFEQLDPEHDGPLAGAELEVHFRRMLCDKVRHADCT
jgi:hypothetical protein